MPRRRRSIETENDVERCICDFLRYLGWRVERRQSGLFARPFSKDHSGKLIRIGEKGLADYQALRPYPDHIGLVQFFYLECKRPGEKLRLEQREWRDRRQREGLLYVVADSFADFQRWYYPKFGAGRYLEKVVI